MKPLDYAVVVAFLALSLSLGLLFTRQASGSMGDFFLSGRRLPWWLAGISMAATNYSIDSPLATAKYVAQHGIAGLWIDWGRLREVGGISGLLAGLTEQLGAADPAIRFLPTVGGGAEVAPDLRPLAGGPRALDRGRRRRDVARPPAPLSGHFTLPRGI